MKTGCIQTRHQTRLKTFCHTKRQTNASCKQMGMWSQSFSVAMLVAMLAYVITHLRKEEHAPTFQHTWFYLFILADRVRTSTTEQSNHLKHKHTTYKHDVVVYQSLHILETLCSHLEACPPFTKLNITDSVDYYVGKLTCMGNRSRKSTEHAAHMISKSNVNISLITK